MSDFEFEVYGETSNGSGGNGPKTDWAAMDQYVVDTVKLQTKKPIPGYISCIMDAGIRPQDDNKVVFTGTASDEADIVAKFPNTYFEDGFDKNNNNKPCRLKCWPEKPRQCLAIAVDFPSRLVDKGQFFGDPGHPKPLRIWMGGDNYNEEFGLKTIGSLIVLTTNKKEFGVESFGSRTTIYKMAVAAGVIEQGQPFQPKDIGKLLGKSLVFNVQVFMKPSKKDPSKSYYTENISVASGLVEGMAEPEKLTTPFATNFRKTPEIDLEKELGYKAVNTLKTAINYPGSEMEKIFGPVEKKERKAEVAKPAPEAAPVKAPVVQASEGTDDAPF